MAGENFDVNFTLRGAEAVIGGLDKAASVLGGQAGGGGAGGAGGFFGSLLASVATLNPAMLAAAGAMAAVSGAAHKVADTLQELSQTRFGLGSSGSTSALAKLLGEAVGIGDIAGLGASLQQASLQGLGVSLAARYGIPYQPIELGGAVDRGEIIMKVIEGLRRTRAERGLSAAIGEARTLGGGAEQLLPFTEPGAAPVLAQARELARLQAQLYSPENVVAGLRMNVAFAETKAHFMEMALLLSGPINAGLKAVNVYLGSGMAFGLGGMALRLFSAGKAPMDANTEAVNRNTAALEAWGAGAFGGGSRLRSAVPGAFSVDAGRGDQLDKYLRMGAFTLAPASGAQ